ncbi:MAG: hypothetical protein ACRDS0_19735 [Pseudonocardiaceae bacterium]
MAMRLCALLAGDRPDALFLVGDGQQAITRVDSLGTVHRAKGLDFAAVYLPRLRPPPTLAPGDPGAGERRLLRLRQEFVARTRAPDRLWIGTVRPPVHPLQAPRSQPGTADPDSRPPPRRDRWP